MATESLTQPAGNLYDDDFVAWASETARLLREGRFNEIDMEHLVEEVEDIANRYKQELRSRLRVLIRHLLKWQQQPEKRSRSWMATIVTQRTQIRDVLEGSPSLRRLLAKSIARVYPDAVKLASVETGLSERSFPRECPFSADQILDDNFVPGG